MKRILLILLVLSALAISTPLCADNTIKDLCQQNVCIASFDFSFNFGFGSIVGGGGGSPSGGSILLETGDFLLTEDSKYLIQE